MDETSQMNSWKGDFGRKYTDRNPQTPDELDELYLSNFGTTRSWLNKYFLDNFDRTLRILEIGCNVGTQLMCLEKMNFSNLFGIEVQQYAVEKAQKKIQSCGFIQGSALQLPFSDGAFDIVFTSGVLIHIQPEDLHLTIEEMYRCTKKYIWGYEYYSPKYEMISYRNKANLMWKADYPALIMKNFPSLKLIKIKKLKYRLKDIFDIMYLISK